jgi:ribosomal protein L11 methyltransferase
MKTETMQFKDDIGYIELTMDAAAENEELLALLLFEQGATGVQIDDPAVILAHLQAGDWDASVFDDAPPTPGRVGLRALFPHDATGELAVAAIRAAVDEDADIRLAARYLPPTDWQEQWKQAFTSGALGERLWLTPYWLEAPSSERISLAVDPGMAFGTGQHGTTAMMLELLEEYLQPGAEVIDLGCGSGILGIAALKLGASRVIGVDIDAVCATAVRRHLEINDVEPARFQFHQGDVLTDQQLMRHLRQHKSQLVLANINAAVVHDLCGVVGRFMQQNGYFICSGVLAEYGGMIAQALVNSGLALLASRERDGWAAFVAVAAYE